jgi:hypothetical protein
LTPEREVLRATIGSIGSWIKDLQALRTWTPENRRALGHLLAQMETGRLALEAVLARNEGRGPEAED